MFRFAVVDYCGAGKGCRGGFGREDNGCRFELLSQNLGHEVILVNAGQQAIVFIESDCSAAEAAWHRRTSLIQDRLLARAAQ